MGRIAVLLTFSIVALAATPARAQCTFDWKPGMGVPGVNGAVYALTSWDPDGPGPKEQLLVVGGSFSYAEVTPASSIAAWDGVSWHSLGLGIGAVDFAPGYVATVYAMIVYNGDLVVAGGFDRAGGEVVGGIARWNGKSWSSLGTGLNGIVRSMVVFNGNLIVGGTFTSAGGVNAARVARWDGNTWQPLGSGLGSSTYVDSVLSLAVFNGNLVAAGTYGVNVQQWNGTSWQLVGSGLELSIFPPQLAVKALIQFGSSLVATGFFDRAGGAPAKYLEPVS
ncbi:MAG: hypothetical protein AABZ08_11120 [Planctomycetota bacterium]